MLELYTDGSCLQNPGGAIGYAAVLYGPEGTELGRHVGGAATGTNNVAELLAVITALELLPAGSTVRIYSDSQYVTRGCSEWLPGWKKRAFSGVKNVELWRRLSALLDTRSVSFQWVKAHNGHPRNELVDRLARARALEFVLRPSDKQARELALLQLQFA